MSDARRARAALAALLQAQNALEDRWGHCDSPELAARLDAIRRGKGAQAERLARWLTGSEPPPSAAVPPGQGASLPHRQGLPTHEPQPGPSRSAPDTPAATSPGAGIVLEKRQLTAELIAFKLQRPAGFSFEAGQSVKLGIGGVSRRYSLVSAPHEPFLEFFVELIPGGAMSRKLTALSVGDTVAVSSAKTGIALDESAETHLMVATVTGINPFISLVRHLSAQGRRLRPCLILHGASYMDELGYRDELMGLAGQHGDWLAYVPTISRPDEPRNTGWRGETGRVGTLVERYLADSGWVPATTTLYACGHPEMIADVSQRFRSRVKSVRTESYQ